MKTKKPIPHDSYPPEEYRPIHGKNSSVFCDACSLPIGKVYPRTHKKQTQEFECIQCGATWFEVTED